MSSYLTFVWLGALMVLIALVALLWPLMRGAGPGNRRWAVIVCTAVAVPLLAVVLYRSLSNWTWGQVPLVAGVSPDIERMVSGLEQKLQRNPNDTQGWLMLGRS